MSLKALAYYGGKAGYGKAQWIASQLPWERDTTYVEPCGGMFGVGLARQPVKCELFNDLDERVVNWWRVLRDEPERFGWAVQCTPISRAEFERSIARMDEPSLSDFERALAFHVYAAQCINLGRAAHQKGNWRRRKRDGGGKSAAWGPERVAMLAERMRLVQLERRDAVQLLDDFAEVEQAVIYVDPPYRDADTLQYRHDVDRDALREQLVAQRGRAAVSGYGDEWDCLGWRRAERAALRWQIKGRVEPRTEVLWMNYDAVGQGTLNGCIGSGGELGDCDLRGLPRRAE